LANLADRFDHVSEVNLLIQGHPVTIMDAAEKLQVFFLSAVTGKRD
jgi:hypothetical protein